MKSLDRLFLSMLWASLLLFPFSTSPDTFVVVHYGHPFLVVAGLLGFNRRLLDYRRIDLLEGLAIVFVGSMIWISTWSQVSIVSLARSGTHLLGLGVFLGLRSISFRPGGGTTNQRSVRLALMSSGMILAIYYIANLILKTQSEGLERVLLERFVGGASSLPWGATNVIGACLLISVLSVFAAPSRLNRLQGIAVALMVLAILSTFSRTQLVLMVLLLVGLLLLERQATMLKILAGLLFVVVVPLGYYLMEQEPETLTFLMLERTEMEGLSSFNDRIQIWQILWHQFLSDPFGGVGYYGSLDAFGFSGHNFLLTTLVEGGIIGIIPLVAFFAGLFFSVVSAGGNQVPRIPILRLNRGALCLGIVILNLLVEDAHYSYVFIAYFWVFAALLSLKVTRRDGIYGYPS